MKGKLLKVLSLAMAISLVASLAACGGNGEEETTAAEETTIEEVVPGDDVTVDGETPSEEETEPATDANGNTVAPPATDKETKAPTQPNGGTATAPTSIKDIVALFNKGAGTMKTASMNRVLDKGKVYRSKPILGIEINLNLANEQGVKDAFAKTKTIDDKKIYSISESNVASATCKDNGSTYTVTINLKSAKLDVNSAKHGDAGYSYFIDIDEAHVVVADMLKAFNIPLKAKIEGGTVSLSGGKYVATIDKASGAITKATYNFTEAVDAQASAMGISIDEANITGHGTINYSK